MYCIHVWRPIMEASSTLENIRPGIPVGKAKCLVLRFLQTLMRDVGPEGGGGVIIKQVKSS